MPKKVLHVPSYTYDPTQVIPGIDIVNEFDAAINGDWAPAAIANKDSKRRVGYGGVGKGYTPIDLDLAVFLTKDKVMAQKVGVAGTTCTYHAPLVVAHIAEYAHQNGGGRPAVGVITAIVINGHRRHNVAWVRTTDDGIWILDAAFARADDEDRWLYRPTLGTGYYHLEM